MSFPSSSRNGDDCVHVQWCVLLIRQCECSDDTDDWRIVWQWMSGELVLVHFDTDTSSLGKWFQFVRPLVNDHTVESSGGVVACHFFAPKWFLAGMLSFVFHQFVVGDQWYLTAWPIALEAMHWGIWWFVYSYFSAVPLQTMPFDDAIVVTAETATFPGTLVPDTTLIWSRLLRWTAWGFAWLVGESCRKVKCSLDA